MMRCRVYWRDDVDGVEELAREPDTPPETCRQRWRSEVEVRGGGQGSNSTGDILKVPQIFRFQTHRPTGPDLFESLSFLYLSGPLVKRPQTEQVAQKSKGDWAESSLSIIFKAAQSGLFLPALTILSLSTDAGMQRAAPHCHEALRCIVQSSSKHLSTPISYQSKGKQVCPLRKALAFCSCLKNRKQANHFFLGQNFFLLVSHLEPLGAVLTSRPLLSSKAADWLQNGLNFVGG